MPTFSGMTLPVGDTALADYGRIWLATCKTLGIEGISLYTGTDPSTVSDWGKRLGASMISKASNFAEATIKNYLIIEEEATVDLYSDAHPGKKVVREIGTLKGAGKELTG
jgi:hypothetical protein